MLLPSPAEIRKWDRVLARDGLPSDAALRHYTFPGGRDEADGSNRHCAHRSLTGANEVATVAADPRFQFWSIAARRAARLPRNFRGRRVVVAIAQTGNIEGSARRAGLSIWSARSLWRRFVRSCGLPDAWKGSIGRPHRSCRPARDAKPAAEKPSPVRVLTKRQIARLNLQAPRGIR